MKYSYLKVFLLLAIQFPSVSMASSSNTQSSKKQNQIFSDLQPYLNGGCLPINHQITINLSRDIVEKIDMYFEGNFSPDIRYTEGRIATNLFTFEHPLISTENYLVTRADLSDVVITDPNKNEFYKIAKGSKLRFIVYSNEKFKKVIPGAYGPTDTFGIEGSDEKNEWPWRRYNTVLHGNAIAQTRFGNFNLAIVVYIPLTKSRCKF